MTGGEMLRALQFRNRGVVRRDMRFEYRPRPCFYAEDVDSWTTLWNKAHYHYLYQVAAGAQQVPPSGMRSAVPLGGLGTGTVELRADGEKVQLDQTFFGVAVDAAGEPTCTRVLQTHPPGYLPIRCRACASATPSCRLRCSCSRTRPWSWATPRPLAGLPIFSFLLRNPGAGDLDVSLL